jgi:glycerol-3-phosphate dehydrogenase (NAD(P)+)
MNLAVLGAGAWGTALAISLSGAHAVRLWGRERTLVQQIAATRLNQRYLPGYRIPEVVALYKAIDAALDGADLALVVTPTAGLREVLSQIAVLRHNLPVLWACKGFETGSAKLAHEVRAEVLPTQAAGGVLSGPSFAQEVAAGKPAALTLASTDAAFARALAQALNSARLRVYSSDDVIGVELGGALKNVMAIAAGISDGMDLGNNARAALITRGLAEMTRLGLRLGGKAETFVGLTGLGDLVLTCTGDLSRNRQVGMQLAQGESLDAILRRLGHVAEGVATAREVGRLAQTLNVDMPITQAVCKILYQAVPPAQALQELMSREPKAEHRN